MGNIAPPMFDCIVAIGIRDNTDKFVGIATGFLYGDYVDRDEIGKRFQVYLITSRHVFEGKKEAFLRFNPEKLNESARDFKVILEENGKHSWIAHSNERIDIAALPIPFSRLNEEGIQANFFQSNKHVAGIEKMKELGIMEGDGVYVLGFPLGIIGEKRNVVIVKGGIIARIRDTLNERNPEYYIDVFVFPGNSGGAVISKAEFTAISGTKSQHASYLIGVVGSYVPYQEEAVSRQTKRTRIIFEENSGLAVVHPVDFIEEIIEIIKKRRDSSVLEDYVATS